MSETNAVVKLTEAEIDEIFACLYGDSQKGESDEAAVAAREAKKAPAGPLFEAPQQEVPAKACYPLYGPPQRPEKIPAELKALPRWICWQALPPDAPGKKWRKVPVQVNGANAKSNDSATWSDYETALAASRREGWGLGFVLNGDGIVGVDLDGCIDSNGKMEPWAREMVRKIGGYAEVSVSGHGVKILYRSRNAQRLRTGAPEIDGHKIEVYATRRYFALTGKGKGALAESPFADALLDRSIITVEKPGRRGSAITATSEQAAREVLLLRSALERIPAEESYPEWIKVGMALKAAGATIGDAEAEKLFDEWSAKAANYGGVERLWMSIRAEGGITEGTIFHLASENGWERPILPAPPASKKLKASSIPEVPEDEVRDIINGSRIGRICRALASASLDPVPFPLVLPHALVLAGASLARPYLVEPNAVAGLGEKRGAEHLRYQIPTGRGQACNVWTLVVAPSGKCKDFVPSAEMAAKKGILLGSTATAEGLMDRLIQVGSGILYIPELQTYMDKRSVYARAVPLLLDTFNKGWFSQTLSQRNGGKNRVADFAYTSVLAACQPAVLRNLLGEANTENGFFGRFLVVPYGGSFIPTPVPWTGVAEVEAVLDEYGAVRGRMEFPTPYAPNLRRIAVGRIGTRAPGTWERLCNEYSAKLAALIASDPCRPTAEEWNSAERLCLWFGANAERVHGELYADEREASYERRLSSIVEFIRENPGATKHDIGRYRAKGSTAAQRRAMLEELVERGTLTVQDGSFNLAVN